MDTKMQSGQAPLAGVVGFFDDPDQILKAAEKVRDANYWSFDCFTPYPVHGMDQAQGLKRSPLPFVTLFGGLTGFGIAFGLQYYTSVIDWALNIGGKPFNSWPAFVPILFELTVLLAALSTVGAMFALNGLPNTSKKIADPSITRDRFAIFIDAPPAVDADDEAEVKKFSKFKPFSEKEAQDFLKALGAKDVRSVQAEGWF
jgi:hypothetical protein